MSDQSCNNIYKHVHSEGGCHTILKSTPEAMLSSVASNLLAKIAKRTYFFYPLAWICK